MNLDMTVGRIREAEIPGGCCAEARCGWRGSGRSHQARLSVVARARTARGRPVVLRGSLASDATAPGTLALRLTKKVLT